MSDNSHNRKTQDELPKRAPAPGITSTYWSIQACLAILTFIITIIIINFACQQLLELSRKPHTTANTCQLLEIVQINCILLIDVHFGHTPQR